MHFRVLKAVVGELDALACSRVIKAEAIAELSDAIDLRARLQADMERLKQNREVALNDARHAGYAEGEREALRVVAERLQAAHQFLASAHALLEEQFAHFVATAVARIADELPEPARMQAVIRHAYAALGNEVVLRIVVHPDDRDAAQHALMDSRPAVTAVLVEDRAIPRRGCRLESPLVVVEHEWDVLLAGIERAARNALRDAEPFAEREQ
ncbi:HrpE/YscL family type III secretion apparatus protein [Burkholderia territorii]|uniref:HrpE/YscL family type III secretion apparatus protein n=1 Tax=Burkholderia territorii TaxID=1503055 RepID=UPI0009BED81D|nr:HrpE/YscL family type III secretion apparatus protein [Burkholderia territorii]